MIPPRTASSKKKPVIGKIIFVLHSGIVDLYPLCAFLGNPSLAVDLRGRISGGNRKAVRPPAQGCRFGYPGSTLEISPLNPNGGCVNSPRPLHLANGGADTTPSGLEILRYRFPA